MLSVCLSVYIRMYCVCVIDSNMCMYVDFELSAKLHIILYSDCFSRHCGRLLCSKCTPHQMPVLKFELMKPVRLCEVCSDVLRLGQDGR